MELDTATSIEELESSNIWFPTGSGISVSTAAMRSSKYRAILRGAGALVAAFQARQGASASTQAEHAGDKASHYSVSVCILTVLSPTDVTIESSVSDMVQRAVCQFQRIDYAVNAAGLMSVPRRSHETTLEEFERINSVDYKGLWLSCRGVIRQMRTQEPLGTHDGRPGNRGAIVNVASVLGQVARPNAAPYCGAKGAAISITQADAIDYSADNIRINCVLPGVIHTPMIDHILEYYRPEINMQALGRLGTADEVADCILFLCSSKATFVQGAAFAADGGYTIR